MSKRNPFQGSPKRKRDRGEDVLSTQGRSLSEKGRTVSVQGNCFTVLLECYLLSVGNLYGTPSLYRQCPPVKEQPVHISCNESRSTTPASFT